MQLFRELVLRACSLKVRGGLDRLLPRLGGRRIGLVPGASNLSLDLVRLALQPQSNLVGIFEILLQSRLLSSMHLGLPLESSRLPRALLCNQLALRLELGSRLLAPSQSILQFCRHPGVRASQGLGLVVQLVLESLHVAFKMVLHSFNLPFGSLLRACQPIFLEEQLVDRVLGLGQSHVDVVVPVADVLEPLLHGFHELHHALGLRFRSVGFTPGDHQLLAALHHLPLKR
mmetsp:Transcript_56881/g.158405  ORF Transcript_56881/g.158405 Transcript_56881/m.158405 type:complete len:230 (-) Transcript_56881:397-1086(-)